MPIRPAQIHIPETKEPGLTATVHQLLAEPSVPYPDPWKPRRERPREFFVLPGEKLSYAERLTAMGLGRAWPTGQGPRLFIRGHFGFNADADRFWMSGWPSNTEWPIGRSAWIRP